MSRRDNDDHDYDELRDRFSDEWDIEPDELSGDDWDSAFAIIDNIERLASYPQDSTFDRLGELTGLGADYWRDYWEGVDWDPDTSSGEISA